MTFFEAFIDELNKIAAESQHSVVYELGKPPRVVDAFEEFKKARTKQPTPALQPKRKPTLVARSAKTVAGFRALAL